MTIKNFRCFRKLKVENLGAVNIFSGQNGVGKTSLLEAVFLFVGSHNTGLPLLIDKFRGVPRVGLNAEEMWGWLFNNHDTGSDVQIECTYENGNSSLVRLCIEERDETHLPQLDLIDAATMNGDADSSLFASTSQLKITHSMPGQPPIVATAWIEGDKLKQRDAEKRGTDGVFLTSKVGHIEENANRFSKLKQTRGDAEILESLKLIEPRLRELTVLTSGGKPIVAGDVGLDQFVPVAYMGEGFNKLLTVVLAIASYPGGIVLIDEIENGFHHSVHRDLWRIITDMSARFGTQLFITTHSLECIHAAHEVSSVTSHEHFTFRRFESDGKETVSVTLDPETIDAAIHSDFEIR